MLTMRYEPALGESVEVFFLLRSRVDAARLVNAENGRGSVHAGVAVS